VSPRHLYIHVPFCARRCGYCDFAVTATAAPPVDAWLEAVAAELSLRSMREGWALPLELDTIYIGGGTPSLLGSGAMPRLADTLRRFATWRGDVEWTAEANPESFTPEVAADWRASGINRISLGAQTFHEGALRWMGRLHGPEGPGRAVAAARDGGFDNISIDLIFGLPTRLGRDWGDDLERALELNPEHVSLYGLTAEQGTPLGRWVTEGRETMTGEESYAGEYMLAVERLGGAGMRHYEVSNFARPGRDSRHNRAYWRHVPYAGVGPGAHSFLPPVRSWNVRDWAEYRQRLAAGAEVEADREVLGDGDVALEATWLGLRCDDGLPALRLAPAQRDLVARWQAEGLAELEGGPVVEDSGVDGPVADGPVADGPVVRLTARGWLLLDRLAVELDGRRG
jgi:oxygen-independent coproporphyrinogen III oxidase